MGSIPIGDTMVTRMPNDTCPVCSKPVYRRPSNKDKVYCSRECYKINLPNRSMASLLAADWEDLGYKARRTRVLIEQKGLCALCEITQIWKGKPLKFHYDHINGKHSGEDRNNVRMICPNCHSQTPTYGRPISEEGRQRQREGGHLQKNNLRPRKSTRSLT
jgi:5-methylcytosine-specific restriction endonuclease McrA